MGDPLRVDGRPAWVSTAVVIGTIGAGIALFALQVWNTDAAWRTCFGHEPDLEAGGRFGATILAVVRLVGYPAALTATSVPAWFLGRRSGHPWRAYAPTLLLTAIGLFWFDYYHSNLLAADDWARGCPSGSPPWWPSWAGIRPR